QRFTQKTSSIFCSTSQRFIMDLAFSDKSASTQQVDNSNNIYTTTTEMISLLEEGEISSMDEVFFNHNDINNPTEIKWSFD
ncbi:7354_t:CDS:1, partial [Entrophospora sp. SA101]